MTTSPFDALSIAERTAMRCSGEAVCEHVADVARWRFADADDWPIDRARHLAARLPRAVIVVRATAAWVHDGLAPPARLHIGAKARRSFAARDDLLRSTPDIDDAQLERLAGVVVTSPARTLADLALDRAVPDARLEALATTVGGVSGLLGAAVACLTHRPYGREAATRLERIASRLGAEPNAQLVTRATS